MPISTLFKRYDHIIFIVFVMSFCIGVFHYYSTEQFMSRMTKRYSKMRENRASNEMSSDPPKEILEEVEKPINVASSINKQSKSTIVKPAFDVNTADIMDGSLNGVKLTCSIYPE